MKFLSLQFIFLVKESFNRTLWDRLKELKYKEGIVRKKKPKTARTSRTFNDQKPIVASTSVKSSHQTFIKHRRTSSTLSGIWASGSYLPFQSKIAKELDNIFDQNKFCNKINYENFVKILQKMNMCNSFQLNSQQENLILNSWELLTKRNEDKTVLEESWVRQFIYALLGFKNILKFESNLNEAESNIQQSKSWNSQNYQSFYNKEDILALKIKFEEFSLWRLNKLDKKKKVSKDYIKGVSTEQRKEAKKVEEIKKVEEPKKVEEVKKAEEVKKVETIKRYILIKDNKFLSLIYYYSQQSESIEETKPEIEVKGNN